MLLWHDIVRCLAFCNVYIMSMPEASAIYQDLLLTSPGLILDRPWTCL